MFCGLMVFFLIMIGGSGLLFISVVLTFRFLHIEFFFVLLHLCSCSLARGPSSGKGAASCILFVIFFNLFGVEQLTSSFFRLTRSTSILQSFFCALIDTL